MSYEKMYIENEYNYNRHDHNVENSNENNENNKNNENNENNSIEMNHMDSWRFKTLYTDTKYVFAPKTDEVLTCNKLFAQYNRQPQHPSCVPVILKDSTRPYTYYTMKSYGPAQDNNYYVNFDDHATNSNEVDSNPKPTFENTGCVKTYLCSLLSCVACCLISFKPI